MATVYVVDDDGLMREMLSRHLEKDNHHVLSFASPKDALPAIGPGHPDFIVSDIQMPGMSGLELVQTLRERKLTTPVVLITGHITTEIQNKAEALGVIDILQKPLKEYHQLSKLIRESGREGGPDAPPAGLDRLRLSFLTGISHELRTPLTAIRLALDGLFANRAAETSPQQEHLVDISQRNMDRIINLVERQIDLLQVALGEVSVSRRLVALDRVIENAAGSVRVALRGHSDDGPDLLFTDPERLQTVIRHILDSAAGTGARELHYHVESAANERDVVFEYEHSGDTAPSGGGVESAAAAPELVSNPSTWDGTHGFQTRVCRRIVESIGGHMVVDRDGSTEKVRLSLPVLPPYEHRTDFAMPLKNVRETAMLTGKEVAFLRCEIHTGGSGSDYRVLEDEFLRRCLATLGEGEAVVRSNEKGVYYLALLERSKEAIDNIRRDIEGHPSGSGHPGPLSTTIVRTLISEDDPTKDPLREPQPLSSR